MARKDEMTAEDAPAEDAPEAAPTEAAGDDDPRHIARAEELARQQEVIDAINAWNSQAHDQTIVASEPNETA